LALAAFETDSRTIEPKTPIPFNPWTAAAAELNARFAGFLVRTLSRRSKSSGSASTGQARFIGRASSTLVDQAMVSAGNFLLNVLLARILDAEDYGRFALFLGAIFILRTVDYSLISYPLSVRLCIADEDERARLVGSTIVLAAGLSLVLVATMGLGIALLGASAILLPGCLCYLCWQAQETLRRCLLADFRYRCAVAGDSIAYVGQVPLVAALLWTGSITLPATLYAMSAAFAVGALVHASKLRVARPTIAGVRSLPLEYFSVGKWSLVSYQLVLVRVQLLPWMLATIAGTVATASLQAGLNIANMMNPIAFGIGNAIPQVAAHAHRFGGVAGAFKAARGYVLFGLGPILAIGAVGALMPDLLLRTVYGPSSPYLAVAAGLQLLMVAGVIDYVTEMISKALLGVQAGKLAFLVNVAALAAALALVLALIEPLGVLGACLALLVANLVRLVGAGIAVTWLIRHERSRAPADLPAGHREAPQAG
jgi:O-antigen/teichoic acid export membrane protein